MNQYSLEYKGFFVKPHGQHPSCYVVVTTGQGGKIPTLLSSMFTTRTLAKEQIDAYLDGKEPTEEKDEKGNKSRSK
jgi:hypothetical protein